MRVDATTPTPAVKQEAVPAEKPKARPAPVKDEAVRRTPVEINTTNVVVEMQKGNVLVYKFIDERSGKLIQQIPAQEMLDFSEAIHAALPGITKTGE